MPTTDCATHESRITRLEADVKEVTTEARSTANEVHLLRLDVARWTTRMTTIWGAITFVVVVLGVALKLLR
jgi:hypothetical protein